MLLVQDPQRDVLYLGCKRVERRVHSLAHRLEDLCSRVVNAIYAVPEAHEPHLALAGIAHPGLGVLGSADQLELLHDLRWRTSVRGPFERPDGADQAGGKV